MAANYTVDSLDALVGRLSISADHEDGNGPTHEEILKHANAVLKTSKGNARALHTKVVALLQLDRHHDALRLLESPDGHSIAEAAALEHAYCLYKVGRLEDAIAIAQKGESRSLRHVAAQALYRLEKFEEVAKIYHVLASDAAAMNESNDLRVNTIATDAQLVWSSQGHVAGGKKPSREDLDVFETAFNAACLSISRNELGQATVLLKRARDLGNRLENMSEEEKMAELEPVIAQQVYVLAKTGQFGRAAEVAKELHTTSLSDDALKPIATNNEISVLSRLPEYNPYLAAKKAIEAASSPVDSVSHRPFGFQGRLLQKNEAVLDLGTCKTEAAQRKAKRYHDAHPEDESVGVINAAAQTINNVGTDVVKRVEALFASDSKNIGLALTLVQLRMKVGNVTQSIETMEKLLESLEPQQRYQPGLVGLLVALFQHQGRKRHVRELLWKASDWWKQAPSPNTAILHAAGKSKLDSEDSSDLEATGELFASLLSTSPSDPLSVAGLVASYATIDPTKVQNHVDTLTPVETLVGDIDVAALESAGVAQPPRKRGAEDGPMLLSKPKKTRRHKKPRLPKDHDSTKKPDPERWLPMRDRSYYKPKGKKDKKKAAAATQGEESMELPGGLKVDVVKVDQKKPGSGAGKKKKKKGGKW